MKKQNYSNLFFIFLFILCFLGILLFLIQFLTTQKETLETLEKNREKDPKIQIVIARYNEDLEWLKEEPFDKYPILLYNKGPNEDFYHAPNIENIFTVKNVGRCDHTYLYHIIENYDNLADITIFLPGSANMHYKINNAKKQILECVKHNNTVFIKGSSHENGVHKELYDFQLDDWQSSDETNKKLNTEEKLLPATIRPFGKWYDAHFPNIHVKFVSYGGIFGISKKHIIQHPKAYYENLIQELNTHSNPEVGHYFERSWTAVFYPNEDAIVVP
jgi:hypothetical protein